MILFESTNFKFSIFCRNQILMQNFSWTLSESLIHPSDLKWSSIEPNWMGLFLNYLKWSNIEPNWMGLFLNDLKLSNIEQHYTKLNGSIPKWFEMEQHWTKLIPYTHCWKTLNDLQTNNMRKINSQWKMLWYNNHLITSKMKTFIYKWYLHLLSFYVPSNRVDASQELLVVCHLVYQLPIIHDLHLRCTTSV